MKRLLSVAPYALIVGAIVALARHGPIAQWPDYHRFADTRILLGVPNALDVLSNVGFAVIALWGWGSLAPQRHRGELAIGWPGWALFLIALMLTAIGSSWYHLAPDNFRLLFDRLPIALACAGLLAAVYAETRRSTHGAAIAAVLAMIAVTSVLWWYVTELRGAGDLRAYLLLQGAPLVLIPVWQLIQPAPRVERIAFAMAIACYVLAKAAELYDRQVLDAVGWLSGHTLKHLLAIAAAALIVGAVKVRLRSRLSSAQ